MSIESIERGIEREEEILSEELSQGLIDIAEYNKRMKQLQREAREEAEQSYEDYFHN